MSTSRIEAFSDGVLAIVITIMVLSFTTPEGDTFAALIDSVGLAFLTYILSFIYVGIYWNNHHHLFQVVETVSGPTLWANLHLLFWLSLLPFTTEWLAETGLAVASLVVYGAVLLGAAVAFLILERSILRQQGANTYLRESLRGTAKEKTSITLYILGIISGALSGVLVPPLTVAISVGCYVVVAILWLVPDPRIERYLVSLGKGDPLPPG